MKSLRKIIPSLLLLMLAPPAFAGQCPLDMKKIDAALADGSSLSSADMARVKELRASGEKLHKSGKHADSVNDLAAAKKILGL